jgi:hypothetical protein
MENAVVDDLETTRRDAIKAGFGAASFVALGAIVESLIATIATTAAEQPTQFKQTTPMSHCSTRLGDRASLRR